MTEEKIISKTFERTAVYRIYHDGNLVRKKKIAEFTDQDHRNEAAQYMVQKERNKV